MASIAGKSLELGWEDCLLVRCGHLSGLNIASWQGSTSRAAWSVTSPGKGQWGAPHLCRRASSVENKDIWGAYLHLPFQCRKGIHYLTEQRCAMRYIHSDGIEVRPSNLVRVSGIISRVSCSTDPVEHVSDTVIKVKYKYGPCSCIGS